MDIDEFLQAQRASGQVDSQGAFTVALEKARQKLGKFQLDDSSFYLLKVVQAAVAGGAARIDLRTSRAKLALWFDAPAPLGSFEQLLQQLGNPLEGPPGSLQFLALGINAALFAKPAQVGFVWWGMEEARALLAADEELAMAQPPPRPGGVSDSPNLYVFTVSKAKPGWFANATAAEHAAVCAYCSFSAADIRVDGHRLQGARQAPARAEPWLQSYTEPFHLVERLVPEQRGALRLLAPPSRWRKAGQTGLLRLEREAETFCLQPRIKPVSNEVICEAAYALPVGLRGADKITMVCHGVKVATVTVTTDGEGAGASAVVSADHLSFDLSGFGVIRDERYHALVAGVRDVWRDMADSVRQDLPSLRASLTQAEKKARGERKTESATCSVLGCLGWVVLMANLPASIGDVGFSATILAVFVSGAVPFMKRREDPHKRLQEAVTHRLNQLKDRWPPT